MDTIGNKEPSDVPQLIDMLGGNSAVARLLEKGASTVSEMRRTKSIAPRHWPKLLEEAHEKNLPITADTLVALHAERVTS